LFVNVYVVTECMRAALHAAKGIVFFQALLATAVRAGDSLPPQPEPPALAPSRMLLDSPAIVFGSTNYDFGKVVAGQVVKHRFFFTNCGLGELVIKDVQSTCGCTSAGLWSHKVEPGKTGTVPIEFFTAKFNGPISKTINVLCNDTNHPVVALELKGTVWRPIEVFPDAAMFSGLFEGTNTSRVLAITNKQSQPLIVSDLRSNHPCISAELRTNRLGEEYELHVNLVPPFGTGHIFGQITMKTSAPEMPVLTVPVWAIAQPAVMALPAEVELPAGPITDKLTRSVSFRNNAANGLIISEPRVNIPGVEVQLHELQPGKLFTVLLLFPPGLEIPDGQKVELTVKSNHPQFPVLKVPIVRPGAQRQASAR
jgi:Protein of unknown function (DUF1573)